MNIIARGLAFLQYLWSQSNPKYQMADAALGAFAVFFMQSPAFLAHQRDMQRLKGHNNAASLFGLDEVPSEPQIRNLLDHLGCAHHLEFLMSGLPY